MARISEIIFIFLRLGLTAFGGPAAHIAMYHDELVLRRKWLDERHFLDLLAATQLIPGPNSTEMCIHIGYLRAGTAGMIAAGTAFIVPSMLMSLGLAWLYVQYGSLPQTTALMYGISPVIIAIIAQALWQLGGKIMVKPLDWAIGAAALALYLLDVSPIVILLGGGAVMLAVYLIRTGASSGGLKAVLLPLGPAALPAVAAQAAQAVPYSLLVLFLTFLKIGSVLYGSGYVLLAFLKADFVDRLGWLTNRQVIDAIAVGQATPGPVFNSAGFIGYLLGGVPGWLLATLGIFLPSFVFVALSNPLIPRLRRSPRLGKLLDGINLASLALMAGVTLELGRTALVDPLTIIIGAAALVLLMKWRVNTTWLLLGGAAVGYLAALVR